MPSAALTAPLRAIFARKPCTLAEACYGGKPLPIEIQSRRVLTADEYDAFADDLTLSSPWLAGKGGARDGRELVIEVTAPGRKALYVNPEGGDWPRYVGIAW